MVLRLRITAPSLPHKYIDIDIDLNVLVCLRMRVYTYTCIFTFGPGVDSSTQPLSAKEKKKIYIYIYIPDVGPSINNKTPCPKPTPRAPLQKKREILFFLRGKIKMLPSHLLILLHARFCSPFN